MSCHVCEPVIIWTTTAQSLMTYKRSFFLRYISCWLLSINI